MKSIISKKACDEQNISLQEALYMLLITNDDNPTETLQLLIQKGYVTKFAGNKEYAVVAGGLNVLENVLMNSDSELVKQDVRIQELAKKLKEVYPKGKKPGTVYYWTDSSSLIAKRLKMFFKKYDSKFEFTDDQIVSATQKYVDSFNGVYTYMQLLKYFIFKEKRNDIGEVESQSELLTYIENAEEESFKKDFSEMRYE